MSEDTQFYPITDEENEKLDKSFISHTFPKADQVVRYQVLAEDARTLAHSIMHSCPPSRERSLALTNLETAMMWANKAIACNE